MAGFSDLLICFAFGVCRLQAAATRSLAQGTTLDKVLDMLKQVVPNLKAPVVLFTYYNPILKRGPEVFMKAVKAAGASGLVVPDLPLEETDKLREFTFANDLELILLTTPTTPQNRAKVIAQASEGFVYLVGTLSLHSFICYLFLFSSVHNSTPNCPSLSSCLPCDIAWQQVIILETFGTSEN